MQNIVQYPKGKLIQNPNSKDIILITSNETLSINRIKAYNLRTKEEYTFEAPVENAITISNDYKQIPISFTRDTSAVDFRELDLETIEKYCLNSIDIQILKNKLQQMDKPLYPEFTEFVKT